MSRQPGFLWDVFISYAWVDNRDFGDIRWVEQFTDGLTTSLDVLFGRANVARVFRDNQMKRSEPVSDSFEQAAQSSAVLLALLSPGFLKSENCEREVALFKRAAEETGGLLSPKGFQRVLPVFLASRDSLIDAGLTGPLSMVGGHDFSDPEQPSFPIEVDHETFLHKVRGVAMEVKGILDDLSSSEHALVVSPHTWLTKRARVDTTVVLRTASLGLTDEAQRRTLLRRAFESVAPALYRQLLERAGGTLDVWIATTMNLCEQYRLVDAQPAVTHLLTAVTGLPGAPVGAIDEALAAVATSWDSHADPPVPPEAPSLEMTCATSARTARVIIEDGSTALPTAWEAEGDDQPRRYLLSRGRWPFDVAPPQQDIQLLARVRHPHILQLTELICDNQHIWQQSAWRPGTPLASMPGDPMPLRLVAEYTRQLADALEEAHAHGVVHGRLSPATVYMDEERHFVSLFGFGYAQDAEHDRTRIIWRIGSQADCYFDPDIAARPLTQASDQHDLALLACRLLLGNYNPGVSRDVLYKRAQTVTPPAAMDVLARALHPDPQSRYTACMQFADALWWSIETQIEPTPEREREHEYLAVMRQECMADLRGYVALRGQHAVPPVARRRTSATGAGRARIKHPQLFEVTTPSGHERPRISDDVSQELRESGRVLLLGEPGSGKTTTLLHAAQMACGEAQANPTAPIPLIVPLNLYDGSIELEDYVRMQLGELQGEYDRLLSEHRLLFIFDALNEAPPSAGPTLRTLLAGLRDFVVSCRSRDYQQDLSDIPHVTTISILPLDLPRVRRALRSLTAPRGDELWELLGGSDAALQRFALMQRHGEADLFWDVSYVPSYTSEFEDQAQQALHAIGVMELCSNPFLLRVVTDVFLDEGAVPQDRSAMFDRSVKTLIRREVDRIDEADGWGSPEAREAVEPTIRQALVVIAAVIQNQQQGAGVDLALASEAMADSGVIDPGWVLDMAQDASLIGITNGRIVFTHQLLQEFFASAELRAAFEDGASPGRFFPEHAWWLPQGWEETAVILVGLLPQAARPDFIRWLAPAQPTVALRCITDAGISGWTVESIPEDLLGLLRECWASMLDADDLGREPRIAVARALGVIGDARPGTGVRQDPEAHGLPDIEWVRVPDAGIRVSRYPVTVAQYSSLGDADGSATRTLAADGGGPTDPQTRITWSDAVEYAAHAGAALGLRIRLPTADEWEALSRLADPLPAGEGPIGCVAPVGAVDHPRARVCDVRGSVWQWCTHEEAEPGGASRSEWGQARLLKGGSWRRRSDFGEPGYRCWVDADYTSTDVGLRLVCDDD